MSPQRVQMSRQHPWRAEHPDAVIVARPSRWGNPYRVHLHTAACDPGFSCCPDNPVDDREAAVRMFRWAVLYPLSGQPSMPDVDDIRRELASKDLACWCPLDQPCHAEVLLDIANGGAA